MSLILSSLQVLGSVLMKVVREVSLSKGKKIMVSLLKLPMK